MKVFHMLIKKKGRFNKKNSSSDDSPNDAIFFLKNYLWMLNMILI